MLQCSPSVAAQADDMQSVRSAAGFCSWWLPCKGCVPQTQAEMPSLASWQASLWTFGWQKCIVGRRRLIWAVGQSMYGCDLHDLRAHFAQDWDPGS